MCAVRQSEEWQQVPVVLLGRVASLSHTDPPLDLGPALVVEVYYRNYGLKGAMGVGHDCDASRLRQGVISFASCCPLAM